MNKLFISCKPYARKADDSGVFAQGTKIETLTGATDALKLMPGSIAIINDKNEILTTGSGTYLKDVKYVRVVYGIDNSADTDNIKPHIFSQPISRSNILAVEYDCYCTPLKQVTFIGSEQVGAPVGAMNLPSPLVPSGSNSLGYSAEIRITKRNALNSDLDYRIRRYEYPIPTSIIGLSAQAQRTAIITALIAMINADAKKFVTAAAVGTAGSEVGISLTADNYEEAFDVSTDGILEYADIVTPFTTGVGTEPVSMTIGCGRPYQVRELEIKSDTEKGRHIGAMWEEWRTWKENSLVQTSSKGTSDSYGYETISIIEKDLPTGIGEVVKGSDHKPNVKIAIEGAITDFGTDSASWSATNSNTTKTVLDTLLPILFGAGGLTASTITEPADDIT